MPRRWDPPVLPVEAAGRLAVETLCRGVTAVLACPDLNAAAFQMLLCCRELVGAPDVAVALFPPGAAGVTLACLDASGAACPLPPARAAGAAGLRRIAARVGRGRIDNRGRGGRGLPLPVRRGARLASLLVAPVAFEGETVGLICLGNKPGGFDGQDLLVVSSFGQLAALANRRCADAESLARAAAGLEDAKADLERRVSLATRRLRAANARLQAEHAFRTAVENALLTGIIVADRDERLIHVNRAFCRMLDWRCSELIGTTPPYPFWPPEDREARLEAFRKARAGAIPRGGVRARYLRRDGQRLDVLIVNSVLRGPGGAVAGVVASVADFTAQVRSEAALRESAAELRRLSTQLLAIEEGERRRISRELHDGLVQALSGLKYRLEGAARECVASRCPSPVRDEVRETARLLGDAVREVRSIVMGLRPSVLDDLGLLATVRWVVREYRRSHPGVRVALRLAAAEADVPEPLKIVLFRILQEALANAARHGRGTRVFVALARGGAGLELAVRDDGAGFDQRATPRGTGLLSMAERAQLSGGSLTVRSAPGRGTVVRARWQL